ncbi:MAG: YaiI/YqxD family protein [Gemmatimonadota bacterium]
MTIWIDADAAPRDVKDIILRAAKRLKIPTVLVANQRLSVPLNNPQVSTVWVQGGPDVADRYIAEHAIEGDVAITADIPLAAILVQKGLIVLDPRGEQYSAENVQERLSIRDFMDSLRGSGVETGGSKPFGAKDKQAFAAALDRVLAAARRKQ